MRNSTLSILLVEDDDVAAESVVRSLKKHNIEFPVVLAKDGQQALNILRQQPGALSLEHPYVILLDLNMPRMNGFEFLEVLRGDTELGRAVVFVLTTSDADHDRLRAYDQHIAGYMVKSQVGPQFSKVAILLREFHAAVSL